MTSDPPDLRSTFDQSAAGYHDARPGYPEGLFDRLFELLPKRPEVLEVGPGTGQATTPMLERGAGVTAVELGRSLAARLRSRHALALAEGRLAVEIGDFEQIPAAGARFHGVVSATAYHWISPAHQISRPAELLHPGGLLAVIDTIQIDDASDGGYFAAADPIYARFGQAKGSTAPKSGTVTPPIVEAMQADTRCRDLTLSRFRWDQTYDAGSYAALLRTYSGMLAMEPTLRERLISELVGLVDDLGGSVTRPLVITLATCAVGETHELAGTHRCSVRPETRDIDKRHLR